MERMFRRWNTLSAEDVQQKIDSRTPEQYSTGGLAQGEYMLPFTEGLIGRSFEFSFQDTALCHYEFTGLHTLNWSEDNVGHTEFYQGHEAENGVYFVQHMIKASVPPQCRTLIIDTNTGLVTICHAQFGNKAQAREVAHTFHFGRILGYASYPDEMHHFTQDLVGKAIYWTYHEGMPPLKHIYSSEYYYTYVMRFGNQCWMATNPADFIKINDHLYVFSFLEERQAGTQGLFLINMETLHDVGSFLGINSEDVFECYTVGAKGRLSTMETYLDSK